MAASGPSIGPWEVSDMEVHAINEVFRQIEEQITLLRGLRNDLLAAQGRLISIASHTHEGQAFQ